MVLGDAEVVVGHEVWDLERSTPQPMAKLPKECSDTFAALVGPRGGGGGAGAGAGGGAGGERSGRRPNDTATVVSAAPRVDAKQRGRRQTSPGQAEAAP